MSGLLATAIAGGMATPASTATVFGSGVAGEAAVGGTRPGGFFGLDGAAGVREVVEGALRGSGEIGAARSVLPQALEHFSGDPLMLRLLAVTQAIDGRIDAARALLEQAGPDARSPWEPIAEALIARSAGDFASAEALVAAALARDPENAYAYNVSGSIAAAQGDLEAAAALFRQALAHGDESAVFRANLISALAAAGDVAAARDELSEAIERHPDACPIRIVEAGLELSRNRLAQARTALERCIAADPENPRARAALVETMLEYGDIAAARRLVETAPDGWVDKGLSAARIALYDGDDTRALQELAAAPASSRTRILTAYAYAMGGAFQQALGALAVDADTPAGAIAASAIAAAAGRAPAARHAVVTPAERFFAALNPASSRDAAGELAGAEGFEQGFSTAGLTRPVEFLRQSRARQDLALGVAYRLWGLHGVAAARLAAATEADPQNAIAAYFAGVGSLRAGDAERAKTFLRRALSVEPNFFSAAVTAAELEIASGELERAAPLLKAALAVREDPGTLVRLGLIEESLGRDEAARDAYERLIAVTPQSYIGYNQLAWHLARREIELALAERLATRANELQPDNASVIDTLGWIAFLRGDGARALALLRQAQRIAQGRLPVVALHLAQAELRFGDRRNGAAMLEALAQRGAGAGEYAIQAARLLEGEGLGR